MGDGGNHGPARPSFRRGRQEAAPAAAGASYLPPTAASEGYGAPESQDAYGGGQDDYAYEDYDAAASDASQASYGEEQVSLHILKTSSLFFRNRLSMNN